MPRNKITVENKTIVFQTIWKHFKWFYTAFEDKAFCPVCIFTKSRINKLRVISYHLAFALRVCLYMILYRQAVQISQFVRWLLLGPWNG